MMGGFEEGQVPPQGRGYGGTRSSKVQPWMHGGSFWKHGASVEAFEMYHLITLVKEGYIS
jgi:hypothetical protein